VDAERLKKLDLFSSLSDEELDEVANAAEETTVDEGESVVRKGTEPYQLFVIEEGSAEVQRDDDVVAKLGEGDVVGEMGAIQRGLRNATVLATSKVKVIYFTQSQVKQLRKDIPDLDERLQKILEERGA
jgi:CRP/FNR family transcriptional regulator, cyclic AMP receptor protein